MGLNLLTSLGPNCLQSYQIRVKRRLKRGDKSNFGFTCSFYIYFTNRETLTSLLVVIKIFVIFVFEWPFYTGFAVQAHLSISCSLIKKVHSFMRWLEK